MRTFRNATLAGATALALTFGGVAVADAAPVSEQSATEQNQGKGTDKSAAPRVFETLGGDHSDRDTYMTNGRALFGSSKKIDENGNTVENPTVAKVIYGITAALGALSVFTLILAPLNNFIKYGPFAK